MFLRIKRRRVPKEDPPKDDAAAEGVPEKVSRLAIGVAGGFDVAAKKFDVVEEYHLAVFPNLDKLVPVEGNEDNIPLGISLAAKAVISAQSATRKAEVNIGLSIYTGSVGLGTQVTVKC